MPMTDPERLVLDLIANVWNAIIALLITHPDDLLESRREIHSLQNRILARSALREYAEQDEKESRV